MFFPWEARASLNDHASCGSGGGVKLVGLRHRAMLDRPPASNPRMFQFHTCSGALVPKGEKTARSELYEVQFKLQNLKVRELGNLVNTKLESK